MTRSLNVYESLVMNEISVAEKWEHEWFKSKVSDKEISTLFNLVYFVLSFYEPSVSE